MTDEGYRRLNVSALKQISKVLEDDPAADIEGTLEKVYKSYAKFRLNVAARHLKRQASTQNHTEGVPPPPKQPRLTYPRALKHFAPYLQPQSHLDPLASQNTNPLPPLSIIYPLSPSVCSLLGITGDEHPSNLANLALQRVLSGKIIWEQFVRAVVQISENVVVKISHFLEHEEHAILQYIEEHFPGITAPRPLGLLTIGSASFMFMTLVPGVTLETKWPSLSPEQKTYIQTSLNQTLLTLRQFKLPDSSPFGSPVGRRLCKDVRRDERLSSSPIYSEDQFNDFLLHSPSSKAAPSYKNWLRSMMRNDHQIVFTHADLHLGNIMVVETHDGGVELAGIIDWEASGFYPEYWEQLKALNTRSIRDTSDWWDYLPPSILGYDHEIIVDRVAESTIIR